MRKRTLLLLALVAALVAVLLWWFRPWSPYSPSVMTRLFHPEYRLDNFRAMENVFPYVILPASDTPTPLPRAATPGDLPQTFRHNGEDIDVSEFLTRTETTGLMVLQDGEVQLEQYFQGTEPTSRLTSWSMAKTVVSTLVAIAHEDGHIGSLDDKVSDYVPALKGKAYGDVSIQHLLMMASGIDFDETYHKHTSDINLLFYRVFLLGASARDVVASHPAAQPSGERFHYISPNTQILAWVLEEAVGRSVSAYAGERLWQPLGMEDDALWNLDQHGVELAFCCLNVTLRDYAKLGQLHLQQGVWNYQQILPEGWVFSATRRPEPWMASGHGYAERGYGYHLWTPVAPDGEYFFNGVWGQTIWVAENPGVVIVKTSVDPEFRPHTAEMISFMRGVTAHYSRRAPASP